MDNNEKETLDEDINLDEISKVIRILKPNKSPGIVHIFEQWIVNCIKKLFSFSTIVRRIYIYLLYKKLSRLFLLYYVKCDQNFHEKRILHFLLNFCSIKFSHPLSQCTTIKKAIATPQFFHSFYHRIKSSFVEWVSCKQITSICLATSQLKTKSRFILSLKPLTFIVARDKVI